MEKTKKVISGLTATGKLTLGNYLGALKNIIEYQESNFDVYLFVADLHAITMPIDSMVLKQNIEENLKLYLACGIDVNKTKLFIQSNIKEHLELFYLLMVNSYEGELKRMTQYKDKAIKQPNNTEKILVGLYMYPILMAADIMLYDVDGVIVGDDQKQHLELTRTLIERMNRTYNLDFKIPKSIISKTSSKIMGLKTPTKKMSKSDSDKTNAIFLLDSPEIVESKIKAAITDSENKIVFDPEGKPGISNLLIIYSSIKNISIETTQNIFKEKNYGDFKKEVSIEINNLLAPIQKKFNEINIDFIKKSLDKNFEKISLEAENSLKKVKLSIGLSEYEK